MRSQARWCSALPASPTGSRIWGRAVSRRSTCITRRRGFRPIWNRRTSRVRAAGDAWRTVAPVAHGNDRKRLHLRYFDSIRNIEMKEINVKRLHLHVGVPDIGQGIAFYTTLFGAP